MRRLLLSSVAAAFFAISSGAALAQTATQRGAAEGADAGGAALGPVGAVVGGVTGAAVGGAADIAHAAVAPLAPPAPSSMKRTTCVTDAAGNRRCDSVETNN